MFSFASKMLNTIMGTEEQLQQQQQQQQGQMGMGGPQSMMGSMGQQQGGGMRPMGASGVPGVRPGQPGGAAPRPFVGPSSFSSPRPGPGGGPRGPGPQMGAQRPMGPSSSPGPQQRFNGPQQQQPPMTQVRGMTPQRGLAPGAQPGFSQPPGQTQQQQMGGHMSPQMRPRGPPPGQLQQQQHQQQQFQQKLPVSGSPQPAVPGAPVPDVDLSHLSAEERAMIENVMAKAQQLEHEAPPVLPPSSNMGMQGSPRMMRPEEQRQVGVDYGNRPCPICRQRDVSGRDGHPGQECTECKITVCNKCGGAFAHPETKRLEWTCNNCVKRRRMGQFPVGPPGSQQQMGVRPTGPQTTQQQQMMQSNMEWDGTNRSPNAGMQQQPPGTVQQQQLPGGGTILQQQQQQRLENEREYQKGIHGGEQGMARPVESEDTGALHGRRLSSEVMRMSSSPGPRPNEGLGPMVSGSNQVDQLDQYYQSPSQLQQSSIAATSGPPHYLHDPSNSSFESNMPLMPTSVGSASSRAPSTSSSSFITLHSSTGSVQSSSMGQSNMSQVQYPGVQTTSHSVLTEGRSGTYYATPTVASNIYDISNTTTTMTTTTSVPTPSPHFQSSSPYGPQSYESSNVPVSMSINSQVIQESSYHHSTPIPSTTLPSSTYPPVSDPSTSEATVKMLQLQQQQQELAEQQRKQQEEKRLLEEQQRQLEEQKRLLEQQKLQQKQQEELAQRQLEQKKQEAAAAAAAAVAAAAVDDKANALMEELSKLQSAVDSTLKKRERVKVEKKERFVVSPPSPSPSPSPPPFLSGKKLGKTFRFVESSPSPEQEYSPDSPETAGPRKAIVLRDYDLDDYKSSSEEESESESDKEQVYYDHNPGEVYTIPEEEDEGGSPTGGDLVTSLRHTQKKKSGLGSAGSSEMERRRMMGTESSFGHHGDQRQHGMRPQLRPQRSMDNRQSGVTGPHTQVTGEMTPAQKQQLLDQQQSVARFGQDPNLNKNTQNQMINPSTGGLDNQGMIMGPQPMGNIPSTGIQNSGQPSAFMPHQQVQPTTSLSSSMDPNQQMPGSSDGVNRLGGADWSNSNVSQSQMGQNNEPLYSSSNQSQMPANQMQQQPYQQPFSALQPKGTQQLPPGPNAPPTLASQNINQVPSQSQQASLQSTSAKSILQPEQQQQLQAQIQQHQQLQQQLQNQQQQPGAQPFSQTTALGQKPFGPELPPTSGQLAGLQSQQPLAQTQNSSILPSTSVSQQQQQWGTQPAFDQAGQPVVPTSLTQFQPQPVSQPGIPLSNQIQPIYSSQSILGPHSQSTVSQVSSLTQQQQQQLQASGVGLPGSQHLGSQATPINPNNMSQAGPGGKSISGLLADFSKALGLGASSPRPSPLEDKSEAFSIPSSTTVTSQSFSQFPISTSLGQQTATSGFQSLSHPHSVSFASPLHGQSSSSAFVSTQDPAYSSLLSQQRQQAFLQDPTVSQALHYGSALGAQTSKSHLLSQGQTVQTQAQLLAAQQAGVSGLGVGVIGALSPAQAHMYQQQMALQHQQQHLKKTRRTHQTTGRDGSSAILLGSGQGLQVTPAGMALTPAVVTSLGTIIGGGPTLLGTSLLQQPIAVTPMGTPIGTPVGTPRSGRGELAGDSSDTMSETDSQKSLRMRRKLPNLPQDQEAAPLPSARKRERQRTHEALRSLSPARLASMEHALGRSYPLSSLQLSRSSASESNLRKLTSHPADPVPRPGSALGLLQGSSIVGSFGSRTETMYPLKGAMFPTSNTFGGMGLRSGSGLGGTTDLTSTTSVLTGMYPSYKSSDSWANSMAELAACLPPDLRHLLNKSGGPSDQDLGLGGLSGLTTSLGEPSLNLGSNLPSYMKTLREQLQEERRQLLSEERRRLEALRERDRELGARLDAVTSRASSAHGDGTSRQRTDLVSASAMGMSRSAGASPMLSRRHNKGHRRQLSDPKLSFPYTVAIQEDRGDVLLQDFDRVSNDILRPPYKSYEYESLEDSTLLRPTGTATVSDWDPSQSYLATSRSAAGGVLRETAISSMGELIDEHGVPVTYHHPGHSYTIHPRRSSEGEAWPLPSTVSLIPSRPPVSSFHRRHGHGLRKHRKSRSWHPSPYVSEEDDEEDDLLSREEKKAKIKAEIARRRQQMQERAGYVGPGGTTSARLHDKSDPTERHSVLKSVDQLLRDHYDRDMMSSGSSLHTSSTTLQMQPQFAGLQMSGAGGSLGRSSYHQRLMMTSGPGPSSSSVLPVTVSPCASEEDRSIERIASTFRPGEEYHSAMLYDRLGEMSPMATDTESMGSEMGAPAAMPLLPDMPSTIRTRSRRLLEDLGSSPIGHYSEEARAPGDPSRSNPKGGETQPQCELEEPYTTPNSYIEEQKCSSQRHQPTWTQQQYQQVEQTREQENNAPQRPIVVQRPVEVSSPPRQCTPPPPSLPQRKVQSPVAQQSKKKYPFPVKTFLLTRDPKDYTAGSNGVGMKVIGGKEMRDTNGVLGAYVAKIFPGGLVDAVSEIHEGDVVLEWNGVPLTNKTFEETQAILDNSNEEIEVVIRSNFNIFTGKERRRSSGSSSRRRSSRIDSLTSQQSFQQDDQGESSSHGDKYSGRESREPSFSCNYPIASEFIKSTSESHVMPKSQDKRETLEMETTLPKSPSMSTDGTSNSAGLNLPTPYPCDQPRRATFGELPMERERYGSWAPRGSVGNINVVMDPSYDPQSGYSDNLMIEQQPTAPPRRLKKPRKKSLGSVQVQICHDPKAKILYVTILRARLSEDSNVEGSSNSQMDPFISVDILPEKHLKNQRRTRHLERCTTPQWNQTMVYPDIDIVDLETKSLEITAWNYKLGGHELLGRVILPLSDDKIVDEKPHTYPLSKDDKVFQRKSVQIGSSDRKSSDP